MRPRVRAATALVGLAALTVTACGGGDGAAMLRETSDKLGTVSSADITFKVLAAPTKTPERGVGFEITGPFSLRGEGPLPIARVRYSRLIGDKRISGDLTSTGREASVTVNGQTRALDAAAVERLGGAKGSGGKDAKPKSLKALGLDVDTWVEDPKVEDGPEIDGDETDRVTGRLRTGRAVEDVLRALRRGGVQVPESGSSLVKRLDDAVDTSTIEVVSGRDDHVLRRLDIRIDLRSAEALAAIPGGGAVRLSANLALDRVNTPVKVDTVTR